MKGWGSEEVQDLVEVHGGAFLFSSLLLQGQCQLLL